MAKTYKVPLYRLKLVKDRVVEFTEREIDQPFVAARFIERLIGNADREHLVALFLNAGCEIVGANVVAIGSLDHAHTTAREVFKGAIAANAHALVLGHNHPSGSLEPSPSDIRMTRKLVFLGRMLSIPVLDHVLVSLKGFRSMHEMGLVPAPSKASEDSEAA
jgi:DNA repair protein RadC